MLALLEAYPRLGRPMFPRNTWRQSLVGDEFTGISQELTAALLRSFGLRPLDELNDIAYQVIEARYMLRDLAAGQRDSLRRMIAADVTIAMAALHILGVVVLDREAGTAGLTDLGRYAVRRVGGMAQPGDPVLQLRVTLAGVDDPPVWRQVVIPAGYTVDRLHDAIQVGFRQPSTQHDQARPAIPLNCSNSTRRFMAWCRLVGDCCQAGASVGRPAT